MSQTAEQILQQLQTAQDVVVEISAPTASLICSISDQARKRGQDRSFEYWLEECAIAGYNSFLRTWKYGDEARDNRDFKKAVNASNIKFVAGIPANMEDQIKFAELAVKYHQFDVNTEDVVALKKEYARQLQAAKEAAEAAKTNGQ